MGFKWLAGVTLALVAMAAGVFVIGNPPEANWDGVHVAQSK